MYAYRTNKPGLTLAAIFCFALFIRLFDLSNIPNGFHVDEIDASYVGRYILQWGKDIYGNPFPITFDKFGDYRAIGIFYLTGISTLLFGMSIFSTRLPSAIFSASVVIAVYYLGLYIFHRKLSGIIASLTFACMPWDIILARSTSEGSIGAAFVVWGLTILLYAIQHNRLRLLISGFALFFVSYLFYHPYRLLGPLFSVGVLSVGIGKNLKTPSGKKRPILRLFQTPVIQIAVIAVIFSVCFTLVLSMSSVGNGRFSQVAFYKNPLIQPTIERLESSVGPNNILLARIFHNKGVLFAREFIAEYTSFFSPSFLLLQGGLPDRYVVPQIGAMQFWMIVLLCIGFVTLFRTKTDWYIAVFLVLLAPLPAALTYEDMPNMQRAVLLTVPLALFAGWGGVWVMDMLQNHVHSRLRNICYLASLIWIVFEMLFFWHHYARISPSHRSFYRNDGNVELIHEIYAREDSVDTVLLPMFDELPIYYLFFKSDVKSIAPGEFEKKMGIDRIGKIVFVQDLCPSKQWRSFAGEHSKMLIVDHGDCQSDTGLSEIKKIVRHDSTNAFRLFIHE